VPRFFISADICYKILEKMVGLSEAADEKGILIQHKATDSLLRACQTQERYQLQPQHAGDFERHAQITGSEAKRFEDMTYEDMLEEQKRILGDDYPGKSA
jgi:hypothetical protein